MTVVEFLEARLAEDERVAREASVEKWRIGGLDPEELGDASWLHGPDLVHATRHDPARVLREVVAKRAILAQSWCWGDGCHYQPWRTARLGDGSHPCAVLLDLASVYADHPDYDQEWRTT